MDTSAVAASTAQAGASARAGASLAANYETFLTLLTTQLKNQDPLSPMDSAQFTQQLVQFTGVEQSIATNRNLETLIGLQGGNGVGQGVAYIGRTVEADSPVGGHAGSGIAWTYGFEGPVSNATLTVTDAAGKLVFATAADGTKGRHGFAWDGRNALGELLPDGAYSLAVMGRDATGAATAATVRTTGRVTGVENRDGTTQLLLGPAGVALDKILKVSETTDPA